MALPSVSVLSNSLFQPKLQLLLRLYTMVQIIMQYYKSTMKHRTSSTENRTLCNSLTHCESPAKLILPEQNFSLGFN